MINFGIINVNIYYLLCDDMIERGWMYLIVYNYKEYELKGDYVIIFDF